MHKKTFLDRLSRLNVWQRGDVWAPHKPLLVLYALANASRGGPRLIPFRELYKPLRRLLEEFGPPRKSFHPEYPFWHLQSDGLWELECVSDLGLRKGGSNPSKRELLEHNVKGGFPLDVEALLHRRRNLVVTVAQQILDAHFPESLHEDILQTVGLSPVTASKRRVRDPEFRDRILRAYSFICCVCEFDVRFGSEAIGVEAAHIKWHQARGPDVEPNGLALCSLHHKLFDRGAFTLALDHTVQVSEHAHGGLGFEQWLLRFHAAPIRAPVRESYGAAGEFIQWHQEHVFRRAW